MFAIVEINGFQFKVAEGDTILVNRLNEDEGKDVALEQVLLLSNGNETRVGQPYLKDVKIKAKVVNHSKADRTLAFKFRRRKNSCSLRGHRQQLTSLNITKIFA